MSVLLIRLSGPMQSWGTRSRFVERDTEREPSKSGVIGLFCAALGKDRLELPDDGQPTLAELARLLMGVRVDREGTILRDYQTAGGGRWLGRPYGVAKASGATPETVVSNRYFLADAVFLVGLEGPHPLLSRLDGALRHPVWPLFLGRKSFVPTESIYLEGGLLAHADLEVALRGWPDLAGSRPGRTSETRKRIVRECLPQEDGEPREDVPVDFANGVRRFRSRRVREEMVELPGKVMVGEANA